MKSQGNGVHPTGMHDMEGTKPRALRRTIRFLSAFLYALLCTTCLWIGAAHAQISYVHDANGRVVAVTQSDGTVLQYSYDTLRITVPGRVLRS